MFGLVEPEIVLVPSPTDLDCFASL